MKHARLSKNGEQCVCSRALNENIVQNHLNVVERI